MNAFDSQTEDSSPAIGRNLRSRPLARKKLSEMVEEELEQIRSAVVNLAKVNNYRLNAN
ncbi:hypothetical protein ACLB1Q_25575 [Escherichia coli]